MTTFIRRARFTPDSCVLLSCLLLIPLLFLV